MLRHSFIHIPGIGAKTEQALWRKGVRTWRDSLAPAKAHGQLTPQTERVRQFIRESEIQYKARNILFFAQHLPKSEGWRLYPDFRDEIVFLDVETTGLSIAYDEITVIGIYDLRQPRLFIRGQDLHEFPSALEPYKILVTFNGSLFDLPFIRSEFPGIKLPPVHLDLRFLLRRLGLRGGLKRIEEQLGMARSKELQGVNGYGATVLWNRYLRGDRTALGLLLQCNLADIVNLKTLLDIVYRQFSKRCFPALGIPVPSSSRQAPKLAVVSHPPAPPEEMISQGRRTFALLLESLSRESGYPVVVGIDLTGSERRPSGWACLRGNDAEVRRFHSDEDLIAGTLSRNPELVSMDSPLSIPRGRHCTSDKCWCRRKYGIARECERELWRRGVRVYPCLLPSMQNLTKRGMRLAREFRSRGLRVIESYPGAAQDILRISRKKTSLEELKAGIRDLGLKGESLEASVNHDELDALTSALVGYFYLAKSYEAVGTPEEEFLIIPKKLNGNSHGSKQPQ